MRIADFEKLSFFEPAILDLFFKKENFLLHFYENPSKVLNYVKSSLFPNSEGQIGIEPYLKKVKLNKLSKKCQFFTNVRILAGKSIDLN